MANTAEPGVRLAHVDGLRALAATFVVYQHVLLTVYNPAADRAPSHLASRWVDWMAYGNYAVTVFMVVSGFSLTVLVALGRGERRRRLTTFMWDRSRRLLPAYWAALAFAVVYAVSLLDEPRGTVWDRVLPASFESVATQALLLHDAHPVRLSNYAFWSIAVEYHVYLAFPMLLWLWLRRGIPLWILVVGTLGVAYLAVYTDTWLRFYPHYYAFFALGAGACVLAFRPPTWAARVPWHLLGFALVATVVVINWHLGVARTFEQYPYTHGLVALAGACWLLGGTLLPRSPVTRLLGFTWLAAIGSFSYSLYLIHAPLLEMLWRGVVEPLPFGGLPAMAVMFVGVAVVVLPAAYGCYYLFERPFLRRPTRAAHDREQRAAAEWRRRRGHARTCGRRPGATGNPGQASRVPRRRPPLPSGLADRPLTRAELVAGGIPPARLRRDPRLRRVAPGTYLGPGTASADERALVTTWARTLPSYTAASHDAAAVLHGLPLPPRRPPGHGTLDVPLDVTVPHGHPQLLRRGVRSHLCRLTADEVVDLGGFLATSKPRTFTDLSTRWDLIDVVALGDAIIFGDPTYEPDLHKAVASLRGRRGAVLTRSALAHLDGGAESPMESRLRMLLVLAGLPRPRTQPNLHGPGRKWLGRVDLYYPDYRLIVEYLGGYHFDDDELPAEYDVTRRVLFTRAGYRYVEVTGRQVLRDGGVEAVGLVRYELEAAGWPGPPRV